MVIDNCKNSVVVSLVDRAIALSNPIDRPEALKEARTVLKENHYTDKYVEKIIKERVNRFYNGDSKMISVEESFNMKSYVAVPYVKGLSEKLSKTLYDHEYKIANKPLRRIKNEILTKTKYKVDKDFKTDVIYKVNCKRCPSTYVGQTKQFLKKRVYAHKNSVKNKNENSSGLAKHAIHNRHSFGFDSVQVLDTYHNYRQRLVAESLYIKKEGGNSCNTMLDLNNISTQYDSIVERIRMD